jgi:hypothetical protein
MESQVSEAQSTISVVDVNLLQQLEGLCQVAGV